MPVTYVAEVLLPFQEILFLVAQWSRRLATIVSNSETRRFQVRLLAGKISFIFLFFFYYLVALS